MLYIFSGSDTAKAKEKAQQLAKGHELVRFGEGGEPFANVPGYLASQGLFSPKVALLLDRPLDDAEGKELLLEKGDDLAEAEALVLVIEVHIDAATKKKLPKSAKVESFDQKEKPEEPPPNVFVLTDAFASGNRKSAWILYRRLIDAGSAPEEIHGALSWQARAMVVSKKASVDESGLKPFVYSKAKRASERMSVEDAEGLSRELVSILHKSRMGEGDLEDLLEAFLLKKS